MQTLLDIVKVPYTTMPGMVRNLDEVFNRSPNEDILRAKKEEIKRNIKKLKLKVDGRDIEEDYDLDDNDRLVRDLQKSKAFDRKAQEHAQPERH